MIIRLTHTRQLNHVTGPLRLLLLLPLLLLLALRVSADSPRAPLRFWAVTGSARDAAMFHKLADDFEVRTGIKVNVTPLAWGNFKTKYFAAMAAGLPPDIGITNLGGPFDYGSVG